MRLMANNKTTITSIPLTSKINMNKNREVIEPNSDMFNDVNAPIYGGNLSNLYYKSWGNGYRSLIDKHGNRYQPTNTNPAGIKLQKFDSNYEENDRILLYDKHFVLTELKNAPYDFDQAIITSFSGSADHGYSPTYNVMGIKLDADSTKTTLQLCKFTVTFDNGEPTYHGTEVIRTYGAGGFNFYSVISSTIRKIADNYFLIYVDKLLSSPNYRLNVVKLAADGTEIASDSIAFKFRGTANSTNYYDASAEGWGSQIDSTCQIIVSANMGGWIGITVLNKKQIGECTHKNLGWFNANLATTGSLSLQSCLIRPAPSSFTKRRAKVNNSGTIEYEGTEARSISDQYVGIFCDDSTWSYIAFTYCDEKVAKHSADENYWAFASNLYGQGRSATITGTSQAVIEFTNNDEELVGTFSHMKTAIWPTLVTNQRHHRFVLSGPSTWSNQKTSGSSYMIDNASNVSLRLCGMQSALAIPTEDNLWSDSDNKSSLWYNRFVDSNGIYNSQGSRVTISGSRFNVLFNYKQGYVSGISYSPDSNTVGTLITEWDSINDDFYIQSENYAAECYWVMWKDCKTKTIKVCHTVNDPFYEMDKEDRAMQIVADRYVIFNTTAYLNCYDIETGKKGHWGSDWNDRVLYGVQAAIYDGTYLTLYSGAYSNDKSTAAAYSKTATTGSGIDVAYQSQKTFAPSKLLPYNTYQRFYTRNAYIIAGYTPVGKIDLFMSQSSSAPLYKTSIIGNDSDGGTGTPSWDGALEGTTYPITSGGTALYNPPLVGTKFINSFAGKYGVVIGDTGYSIQYDGVRPVGLYNTTSMVDNIETFFIIQSQYYAVINDYICAVSYSSSNILNGIEQIVNVNGMQFIGALPSVAYFYSPAARSIYAFTGDSDLQLFVQTDLVKKISSYCYAPNNEWIYLLTNNGLYVLTQQNVFRTDEWDSEYTWRIFATDQDYNIIESNSGSCRKVAIDKEDDGYDRLNVKVATAFFGPGDMKQDNIDTWYIRVYKNGIGNNGSVWVCSKTLSNNKVVNNGTLVVSITADMWDENDSYTIRYQPENPIGLGQSLIVDSRYPIAAISYSHQADSTATPIIRNEPTVYQYDAI